MKMIAPLSGVLYFHTALRKTMSELTDWPEPKMEVRPLELAANRLLSESRFLPLLHAASLSSSLPLFVCLIAFGSLPATKFRGAFTPS